MELELPDNVGRYFRSSERSRRRRYREWKVDTIAKYGVSVLPLGSADKVNGLEVAAKVEGNFPGSPVDLTYDFALDANGLIHALEIH